MSKTLTLTNKPEKDLWQLADDFMNKITIGDKFSINDKPYIVKCIGRWKSKLHAENQEYKTLTVKCQQTNNQIKFFYFYGYHGKPDSKSTNANVKQHQLLREIESILMLDFLNYNNPFHKKSDIYNIAIR